jgi:uncharacterized protein YjbI with pentapeptide repeats
MKGEVLRPTKEEKMRTHSDEELSRELDLHSLWLKGSSDGKRANLTVAILTEANLTGADLTGADLRTANLTGADLTAANLDGAKLLPDGSYCHLLTGRDGIGG